MTRTKRIELFGQLECQSLDLFRVQRRGGWGRRRRRVTAAVAVVGTVNVDNDAGGTGTGIGADAHVRHRRHVACSCGRPFYSGGRDEVTTTK
jgi:hypothetical protein